MESTLYRYSAFGLEIESVIALCGLTESSGRASDIFIHRGPGPHGDWPARVQEEDNALEIEPTEARFWFKNVGTFIVRDGKTITVTPAHDDADCSMQRLYIEGMVMAAALHQRGLCVLHASVIETQGSAVAFMGQVGAGKSSIAAAFYKRNYRILSDDNAVVRFEGACPYVSSGYPYVKLFPAIAQALGFDLGTMTTLPQKRAKMAGDVASAFSDSSLPLRNIYILGHDYPPRITQLSRLSTTIELIRNAVPTRWCRAGDAQQLRQCAAIADQVPVFTVKTFRDISEISELVLELERHQRAT